MKLSMVGPLPHVGGFRESSQGGDSTGRNQKFIKKKLIRIL